MTLAACVALSALIHEEHGRRYEGRALGEALAAINDSRSSLVGVAVASEEIIASFDPELLSIEEMAAVNKRFAAEFREARHYLCRDGKARSVDRVEFFGLLWMRIIEREKKRRVG